MAQFLLYFLPALFLLFCALQEKIRFQLLKQYSRLLTPDTVSFRLSSLFASLLLLAAVICGLPLPAVFFLLIVVRLFPYRHAMLDLCIQTGQLVYFMSIWLTYHGCYLMAEIEILPGMEYLVIRFSLLCLTQVTATLFYWIFQKFYPLNRIHPNYDKRQITIFFYILLFCASYAFADSLLHLLDADFIFVPITMVFGNLLILLLITAILCLASLVSGQALIEQEYQTLESERAQAAWQQQKLLSIAQTDALTGVFSRRYVTEQLALLKQSDTACAAVYMDMDHMKEVNDQYGHAAGDRYLQQFASRLASLLPPEAFLARMGGDEFVAVLPHFTKEEAIRCFEELLSDIQPYSFSFGAADSRQGFDSLLQRADQFMYVQKSAKKRRTIR